MPPMFTWPMAMQTALSSAISNAARKAPGMLPMPPTTTTTNASPMATRSSPRLAGSRGNCSAPPRPARKAPSANTPVNSSDWFTPSAPTISLSCVAALTRTPKRLRVSIHHSRPSTSGPMTISARSYWGKARSRISTDPRRPGARGPSRSSLPQTASAASRMISTSAKVASSWNSSGAR